MFVDSETGHLKITPSPTCMEKVKEPECGHCVTVMSGTETFIGEKEPFLFNGKPWSQVRQEAVYLPAKESYGPLATYIINSCKKLHCSGAVEKFKIKLDSLSGAASAINENQ